MHRWIIDQVPSEEGNWCSVVNLKSKEAELRGVVTTGSHKLSLVLLAEKAKRSPQEGYWSDLALDFALTLSGPWRESLTPWTLPRGHKRASWHWLDVCRTPNKSPEAQKVWSQAHRHTNVHTLCDRTELLPSPKIRHVIASGCYCRQFLSFFSILSPHCPSVLQWAWIVSIIWKYIIKIMTIMRHVIPVQVGSQIPTLEKKAEKLLSPFLSASVSTYLPVASSPLNALGRHILRALPCAKQF